MISAQSTQVQRDMSKLSLSLFCSSSTIYLLSALVAVWAAGYGTSAWLRFFLLAATTFGVIVSALAANRGHARNQDTATLHTKLDWLGKIGVVACFAATLVAIAYLLRIVKSEVAADILIALIPLSFGGLKWVNQQKVHSLNSLLTLGLGISALGLLLTQERSAWLSLAVGVGIALLGYAGAITNKGSAARHTLNHLMLVGLVLLLGSAIPLVATGDGRQFIGDLLGASPYGRLSIWQDALALIQDYRFTGSGLGQTGMVLSTYVYLFQVPFLSQAYNLFLQIGIEQGIAGIIGFVGMSVAAIVNIAIAYRNHDPLMRWFCTVALASLIAMMVHGVLDAGLYVSNLVPFIFTPIAFAMLLPSASHLAPSVATPHRFRQGIVIGSILPVAVLVCIFLQPDSRSLWHANLGAVEQSRRELSTYAWPNWAIQDQLRRSNAIDLSSALAHYERALQLDPANATAHRRLGQIALSQGNYDLAREHLQFAYDVAPEHRATRQLLGELYAVTGNVDRAVEIWQSGDTDPHKLELRQWWYSYLGANQEMHWLDEAVARYKDTTKHHT